MPFSLVFHLTLLVYDHRFTENLHGVMIMLVETSLEIVLSKRHFIVTMMDDRPQASTSLSVYGG